MPLASNLLSSRAFAAQLAQFIQARLSEGGSRFALLSGRARGDWWGRFGNAGGLCLTCPRMK
ncbi:hypothetical protein CRX42_22835, partial [Pseudomonas jessenii]